LPSDFSLFSLTIFGFPKTIKKSGKTGQAKTLVKTVFFFWNFHLLEVAHHAAKACGKDVTATFERFLALLTTF
jgi:hypothetical protein